MRPAMLAGVPWTLVHPAAVLPLKRPLSARLPFDALVIGSMSPDFGYYAGAFRFAARAHTAPGIVLVCLPLSLAVYALIRHLYAPVTALLPDPHRRALESLRPRPLYCVPGLLFACLAILIGAATHNIWDSFTHNNGTAVALLPWLRRPVGSFGGHVFTACETLQHVSTLLGAALLILAYRRWLKTRTLQGQARTAAQDAVRRGLLAVLFAISLLAAGIFQATLLSERDAQWGWMGALVRFVITATTAFAVILALAAVTLHGRGPRPQA